MFMSRQYQFSLLQRVLRHPCILLPPELVTKDAYGTARSGHDPYTTVPEWKALYYGPVCPMGGQGRE